MTGARRAGDVAPAAPAFAAILLACALPACDGRRNVAPGDASPPDGPEPAIVCEGGSDHETPPELTSPPFVVLARNLDVPDDATAGGPSRLSASATGVYAATRRDIELVALHAAPVVVFPDAAAVDLTQDGVRLYWLQVVGSVWQLDTPDSGGRGVMQLATGAAGSTPRLAIDENNLYVSGPCAGQGLTAVRRDGSGTRVVKAPCAADDLRQYDFLSASHGFLVWMGVVGNRDRAVVVGPESWASTRRNLSYDAVTTDGASFFGVDTAYDPATRRRDIRVSEWPADRPESPVLVGTFHVGPDAGGLPFDVTQVRPSGDDLVVVTDPDDGPFTDLWRLRRTTQRARRLARVPRGSHLAVRDGHLYVTSRGVLYGGELSAFDGADGLDAGCATPAATGVRDVDGGAVPAVGFDRPPWSVSSDHLAGADGAPLVVADDGLYLSTIRGIERLPLSGGDPTVVVPGARAIALRMDGESLYWVQQRDASWELLRSDPSGDHRHVLAHGPAGAVTSLASDRDSLYVSGSCRAHAITAVSKRGGPSSRLVAPCDETASDAPGYPSLSGIGGYLAYRTSNSPLRDVHLVGPRSWRPERSTLPFDQVTSDGAYFYGEQSGDRRDGWRLPLWRWTPEHPEAVERVGHLQDGLGQHGGALVVAGGYALSTACPDEAVTCTLNVLDIPARHAAPIATVTASQLHGFALHDGTVFVHYGASLYRASVRDVASR